MLLHSKILIVFITCGLWLSSSNAQTLNLVNTVVSPPSPAFLYEFPSKTQVIIQSVTSQDMSLRISIKGDNGIVIRTKSSFNPFNIVLTPNETVILTEPELQDYFLPQNLVFTGISEQQINEKGLPPGNYHLCVRLMDADGSFASGDDPMGCSNQFPILSSDPPFLTNPVCGYKVNLLVSPGINFTWTPSPGAKPFTSYTLRIVEFPDSNMNPNTVMYAATTPYFFEKEIQGYTYFYTPADPPLQNGKNYAWIVTAKDVEGGTWFKKNGQSEVCWFSIKNEASGISPDLSVLVKAPPPGKTIQRMPYSTVTGNLRYLFNSPEQTQTTYTSTTFENNSYSTGGVGAFYPAGLPNAWSGQAKPSYAYNQGIGNTGSKPLANMKISLVKKYVIKSGYFYSNQVSDYILEDKGHLQQSNFEEAYPNSGQVMATTTTDEDGNFSFLFLNHDSIGFFKENVSFGAHKENTTYFGGTVYSTYKIIVESPYYCSPENDIIVQPYEHKAVGDVVSLVRDYRLKITTKSAISSEQQIGGSGNALNDVEVSIIRVKPQKNTPPDEGQNLHKTHPVVAGTVISQGKTGQDGSVTFNRLVRHQQPVFPDRYKVYCKSNKLKGNYNYHSFEGFFAPVYKGDMPDFPYTGYNKNTIWNSQYVSEQKSFEISMWPDKPRVFGRVTNTQGKPLANVKCVIISKYTNPANFKPEKFFKVVYANADGYFEFNDLEVEFTGPASNTTVEGPARTFAIKVPGYRYFEKSLGILVPGQQIDLKTVALEPDGQVAGYVVDEDGMPVASKIIFNDQISTQTKTKIKAFPSFTFYESFQAQVPSGNVTMKVMPNNPEYEILEKTIKVNVSNAAAQDLGALTVLKSRHRIRFWVKEKNSGKAVKGVLVKIKNSDIPPATSNEQGEVLLQFSSPENTFYLEAMPPETIELMPESFSIYNTNSIEPKVYGSLMLQPSVTISGTVTFGTDHKVLPDASVFVEQGNGGTKVLVKTDDKGYYKLGKIALSQQQVNITAAKSVPGKTIIARTKTIDINQSKTLDFHLPVFDKMSITEIYGLPVIVDTLKDEGATAIISGRFISLPDNKNFTVNSENFMMEFENITMQKLSKTTPEGVPLTKPQKGEVPTLSTSIPVKIHSQFYGTQTPQTEHFSVKNGPNDQGFIEGYVQVESSSFQFSGAVLSFQKESPFLCESKLNKVVIKTFCADEYPLQTFNVSDKKGEFLDFSVMGFNASASPEKSFLDGATISLMTTLHLTAVPLMIPQKMDFSLGNLLLHKDGFEPLSGTDLPAFTLEKWKVKGKHWAFSKANQKLLVNSGELITGLANIPFKTMGITPSAIEINGIEVGNLSLAGVTPLEILSTNTSFLYDPVSGADMKPHWRLAVIGTGGLPAARIQNLPGMQTGESIKFQVFEALSNNENQVSFGNQNQQVAFYKVYKMTPTSLNNYENYFQLSGTVDLGIPRVNNNFTGILQFSKQAGQVVMEVKNLPVNFEAPGKVHFYNLSQAGTQKLDPSGFEVKGQIKDDEGVMLYTTLYRKPDDIYIKVEPYNQILPIGGGDISLKDVKGGMKVQNNDWGLFSFDGVMAGAKGIDGQQRLAFTIFGDIKADAQSVSLKNITTPFGNMAITYDFKNGRMIGDLNINQNLGGIGVMATANLLVDADGYYIMAGGQATPPGIGLIQAGMIFGNYPTLEGNIKNTLMQYAYNKNIPATFSNGISGFFITGTKTFPIDIPDLDVDLGVVSVAFGADLGADARIWMNFANPGTNFGIGAMAFAHAYFSCASIVCTEFNADARAELGSQGDYQTSSGTFSLQGCGSITVSASGSQCTGAMGACVSPCVDLGFSKSIKVDLLLNSQGDASINLGLGNCSGQPPLTGGW